jgi:hypothetical protein
MSKLIVTKQGMLESWQYMDKVIVMDVVVLWQHFCCRFASF